MLIRIMIIAGDRRLPEHGRGQGAGASGMRRDRKMALVSNRKGIVVYITVD